MYGVYVDGVETQAILNNTISDCDSYGIYIYDSDTDALPTSPEIRGNVINNCSYPIYISSGDGYTGEFRITDNSGTGNTYNYIHMEGNLKGNVKLGTSNALEWVFQTGVQVSSGAVWELGADEVIKTDSYSDDIRVYGTLTVSTTADHPVVFTSLADNEYGYPIGSGTPAKGNWGGIYVSSTGTAVLDHAIIRYGGYSDSLPDALVKVVEGGSLTLTNSILEHSAMYGVYVGSQYHYISGNRFNDIDSYAVFNGNTTEIDVKAENNWWGDNSGPDPYGTGYGINYRSCYNSTYRYYYICEYYVDADPWIGKTEHQRSTNGQNVPWQHYDADPVNTATGNYAYAQSDLTIPVKGELDFVFQRSYNSLDPSSTGVMGHGWQHSYQISVEDYGNHVLITYGDGQVSRFIATDSGFQAPVGNYDVLTKEDDGTFRLRKKDQTLFTFDLLGRVTEMIDRNGHGLTFAYVGTNLSLIKDTDDRTLVVFTYTDSRLSQIVDLIGRIISFTYDMNDNLESVIDVGGGVTQFSYDSNHRLLTITDANEHVYLTNQYDVEGRVEKQWDAEGYTTEFFYDEEADDTLVVDRRGYVTKYDYDELGRLQIITNPLTQTIQYSYDEQNNIISQIDARGYTTTYTYDERGNRLTTTDALGGFSSLTYDEMNNPLSITDANGFTTTYTYDVFGNRLTETDPLGNSEVSTYYTTSGFEGLLMTRVDRRENPTNFAYDTYGNLNLITNALGDQIQRTFDGAGRKLSETNPRGFSTTYTYDNFDRVLTNRDALGGITSYTYDLVGNMLTKTDANGKLTTYTYTDRDKLSSVIDPEGYITTYSYDAAENLISETDGNGNSCSFTFDALNRKVTVTNALNQTTSFMYDASGNLIKVTDPLGHSFITTYNALNWPTYTKDPLNNESITHYDAVGNKISFTDSNNHTTTYTYDGRNQMTSVTDALGGVVNYGYDASGNRIFMLDANQHQTTYTFDALNRMVTMTNPLGNLQSISYDQSGNVATSTDGNGDVTFYTYDQLDRTTKVHFSDDSEVIYSYDLVGNRLSMMDGTGTTSYTYDNLYRPVAITSSTGSISYTYDAINRLSVTTPAGTVSYGFDGANNLLTVTDWDSQVTQYTYDAAGRLVTTSLPNGIVTTNTYDAADRLISITHKKGSTVLESFAYVLDKVGNRLSMTDADGTTSYTYDALDRLIQAVYPSGTPSVVAYTYDAMGNRLTMTQDGVITNYSYDEADRLITRNLDSTPTGYTWDYQGNLLTKGGQTYTWFKTGKLATWSNGSIASEYVYDGDGVRVGYSVDGVSTSYLQDLGSGMAIVLRELTGTTTIDYLYGIDLIAQKAGMNKLYMLTDGLGSTRLLTDSAGSISARYSYDAFGLERSYAGVNSTGFTFAGEQMDSDTGLQYLRARYYDPEDGRFISVDPVPGSQEITQSLNFYVYVENNSVNKIDPRGTSSQEYSNSSVKGTSTKTSSYSGGTEFEYPGYYKLTSTFLKKTPKWLKIFGIGSDKFWQFYGYAKKIFKYVDLLVKDVPDYQDWDRKVDRNRKYGKYGDPDTELSETRAKALKISRVFEDLVSLIPSTIFPAGEPMKETRWLSGNAERLAKRSGYIESFENDPTMSTY